MADLHPEVLALIEAGPQVSGRYTSEQYESIEEFARRIAMRAVELEREKAKAGMARALHRMTSRFRARDEAIRRRGKP